MTARSFLLLPHLAQELETVHPRHTQITDHQTRPVLLIQKLEGLAGVVEGRNLQSGLLQGDCHRLARPGLIVDHKDLREHRHTGAILA